MSKRIIDIFTDASSYNNGCKIKSEPQHTCSACIVLIDRKPVLKVTRFNPNTTNNYGEIYAIWMALKYTLQYLKEHEQSLYEPYEMNLYSDSNICVSGLNDWIYNWLKNTGVDGLWYNSSGLVVSNQHIFKLIYNNFIINDEVRVNINHIRGHINLNKKSDVDKAMKSFYKINKRYIDFDDLKYAVDMNNAVDRLAVDTLADRLKYHDKNNLLYIG